MIFFTVRRRFSLSKEANARYDAKTAYYVSLKLNKRTDTDLIAALEAAPSKQAFIKEALRAHIAKKPEDRG